MSTDQEKQKKILAIARQYGMEPSKPIRLMVKKGSEDEQQYVGVPPMKIRILFFPSDETFLLLTMRESEDWEIHGGLTDQPEDLEYLLDPGSLQDEGYEPVVL